jgi:diguanylate cyclase (GGDEF)-like protein
MSTSSNFKIRGPRYALHYVLTAILTTVMLCGMTLYYGFAELRSTAQDVAQEVFKAAHAPRDKHVSIDKFTDLYLTSFRDVERLQVCANGQCATRAAEDGRHVAVSLLNDTGLPCATAGDPAGGNQVTACMAMDGLLADISRDVIVLLLAQGIGFGLWVGTSRRFAARRKVWNDRVNHAASTDAATGLLNRSAFRARLDSACKQGCDAWLVNVGIDELRSINQLYGSPVGDRVIRLVAQRLQDLEGVQGLGRLDGDEFAFLIEGAGPSPLERALYKLRAAMTAPLQIDGLVLPVTVCVGAVPLRQGLSASELKRRANVALRAAKRIGADSQSIFNETFDIELSKAHQLRLDLMAAVDKDQIELMYQPIVDGRGQVIMAEALARWRHPTLGPVSPEVFIAAAEASGHIHLLGVKLLKKACADLAIARKCGLPLKRIAVNVSPAQLNNPDMAQIVIAVVEEFGLQPSDIELELTESAAMTSRQEAAQQLHQLAEAGFQISIDDFGTGYSSLSRLQTLPISKLKIDRSFVQVHEQPAGAVLLEAMLDLSRRLTLDCVAEGIETEQQLAWLRAHGCNLFQGYLIGKPMTLEQLIAMGFRAPLPSSLLTAESAPSRLVTNGSQGEVLSLQRR